MHTPMTADPSCRAVDEQFLELICDDPDLLDAEFAAIVAAEWPVPPARARPSAGVEHSGGGPARRGTVGIGGRPTHPPSPVRPRWMRQRSPPARAGLP